MGKKIGILVAAVLVWGAAWGMGVDPDSLAARMDRQRYLYPQEKFHVMTDQSCYMGGDTIWLRGFVVDAATHQPVSVSKYLYVELRNPFHEVQQRVKIIERKGVYSGYIPLDVKMPEGEYTLAAYTMFGESAGEDYFFKKRIDIRSPFSTRMKIDHSIECDGDKLNVTLDYVDRSTGQKKEYAEMTCNTLNGKKYDGGRGRKTRHVRLSADDCEGGSMLVRYNNYEKYITIPQPDSLFDVTFHPEGGYAVPGTSCCMAFKAIDRQGRGVAVRGTVLDSVGNEVARFRDIHRGMGVFTFVPVNGQRYTAVVQAGDAEREFQLPEVDDRAAVLHVDNSRESSMVVEALGRVPAGAVIVGLQRGQVRFVVPVSAGSLDIDKSMFSSGVVQVLLLAPDGTPLSERLAFVRGCNEPSATAASHLSAYLPRTGSKVLLTLDGFISDRGSVAVAVTDNKMTEADTLTTIASQLLLQSELKGYVEDVGYYFRNPDRLVNVALDALMLTQGWRRYDVPKALQGVYAEPSARLERGQELTGRVLSMWRKKPLSNARVNVLAPDRGFALDAPTDAAGCFSFKGFNFPEGTKFIFQALNRKGKNEFNFMVDRDRFPEISAITPTPVNTADSVSGSDLLSTESGTRWRMAHNNGVMEVLLDEVSITYTKLSAKKPDDVYEAMATMSFSSEYIDDQHISTYDEILRKIPGLSDEGGVLYHRGKPVSYFVDGVAWSMPADARTTSAARNTTLWDFEQVYPLFTVKRIDFFRGGNAVLFSLDHQGGVLMITTKDGSEIDPWKQPETLQVVVPLGYQKPAEFYSPKYEANAEADGTDMRPTVYWNPNVQIRGGKAMIEFYTSDSRDTDYTVRIEGLTDSGEIIHATTSVHVQ